ncbi:MAG: acetamidase/formamidase family protein [Defluviitaleaceae bacterium]|nr:acetamidase/formamidase family protein [Defluviitaleaceae bacterium]
MDERIVIKRDRKLNYYDFLPDAEPRASISSGDRLIVETYDAAGGMFLDDWVYVRPNPVTGPIFVRGALPGDALEIKINDIKLIGTGYMHVPNAKAGVKTEYTRNGCELIKAEAKSNTWLRVFNNGKTLPADPMIGVIGVAAPIGLKKSAASTGAGEHGGNMDNKLVRPGAKVFLPVFAEGALLGLGDAHGCMGDGEFFDQGMEMCADLDITVTVRKDVRINGPLVLSDGVISTVATADSIEDASALVVAEMRFVLESMYNLSHADAGLAIGFYGNLRICQIVNKTVRMEINESVLERFR